MPTLFKNYTGSAFLNNALQTIEVLAAVESVKQITPNHLLELYQEKEIWKLFKRMKSYSMLFTRNGPLLNDKQFGEKIYKGLIEYILNNFESEGEKICEISGLKFQTSFEEVYEKVLIEIGYPVKKIKGKDKTINRCWFPLIGALGSDAQALPQAKFNIKIHPICLVVIQFLPFSSLLYKGGILLFDSTNFEFSKDFVEENVERILKEINLTAEGKSVENIKDFNKGTHLLRAMQLFSAKKDDYEDLYSDLNLWSFSNSGTGASCLIDRVPNQLFKQLLSLYYDTACREDLKILISDKKLSNFFLEKLEAGADYWRLYPSKKYEGVSVPFYEHYQKLINNDCLIPFAKYIAYLVKNDKELKKSEIKLLEKTDAHTSPDYGTMIFATLVRATENKKWTIHHHLEILDKPNVLPLLSNIYGIFKMVHFYYQQEAKYLRPTLPLHTEQETKSAQILQVVIPLIEKYETDRKINIQNRLLNAQESKSYSLRSVFINGVTQLNLVDVYSFYFKDFIQKGYGLNDLLRIYYSNPVDLALLSKIEQSDDLPDLTKYLDFASFYIDYYQSKYPTIISNNVNKFQKHVLKSFPKNNSVFYYWLEDAKKNILLLQKEQKKNSFTNYSKEEIIQLFEAIQYDEFGNKNLSFARFAIQFSLHKNYLLTHQNVEL